MPDEARLKALLVGRSVVAAEVRDENPERYTSGPTGYLTLDDGTVLKVWGNDGGCACSAGCYPLANLATCENVITNVQVEEMPDDESSCGTCGKWYGCEHRPEVGHYRIFVWAEEERVNLASFEGSDGNGYYGTGWWLSVQAPAARPEPLATHAAEVWKDTGNLPTRGPRTAPAARATEEDDR